jgi:hypothetical protein
VALTAIFGTKSDMTLWVKSSGIYVAPDAVWVKDGGTWHSCEKVYVKSAGSWVEVFSSTTISFAITAIGDTEISPTNASASLAFNSDGTVTTTGNSSAALSNWHTPTTTGIGSSYWVQLTINSGSAPSSGSAGAVIPLSAGQTWTWNRTTNGTTTANCTITVYSDSGGVTAVGSDTFNVSVAKEV